MRKRRFGFKGKMQLPLFLVWDEFYDEDGNVVYARVVFDSTDWIGF